jgi:DNA-directed RNA polymerase subunit H
LDIDIFNSRLSPKYRTMKQEEIATLLKKFNIVTRDLPKIKSTDPAVKRLGANDGDVLEISRDSKTAGEAKYYRFVVK